MHVLLGHSSFLGKLLVWFKPLLQEASSGTSCADRREADLMPVGVRQLPMALPANVCTSSPPGCRQFSLDADQVFFPVSPADGAVRVLFAVAEIAVCFD